MIKSFYSDMRIYEKPCHWMEFYFYVRIPLGIIVSILNALSYFQDGFPADGTIQIISLIISTIFILLVMSRKKFSYACMLIAVAIESFSYAANGIGITGGELWFVFGFSYAILNFIYFSRRNDFFVKTNFTQQDSQQPDANQIPECPAPPCSDENIGAINHSKKRYCKYCGQEIDQSTKKCTGCGKQYFVFKRLFRPAFYCLLIVSIIANIVMGIVISDYKYEYEITSKDLEEAKGKAESYREKAGYLDNHIAFTTDNGTRYHMYSCWHLKDNHDNMWTVEEVKRAGYQKCLDCH